MEECGELEGWRRVRRARTRGGRRGDVATNPTGCKVEANTSGCTCSSCYCRPCNDTRSTSGRHNFKGKDPRFDTVSPHREREKDERRTSRMKA